MHCPVTRKVSFISKSLAEEALFSHHARQFHLNHTGPINVYQCDECGDWHFTSKGDPHPDLFSDDVQSRLKKEREATHWERRLRR